MQSSIRSGRPEARIVLQPLAAPSVLGYFALASALIVYGSWFAGGWGTESFSVAPIRPGMNSL